MGMQVINYDIKASRLSRLNQIDDEEIPSRLHLAYFGREHFVIPACREQSGRFSASA